jgi:hypothetical protein
MYGTQIAEREQMLNDEPMATLGDLYGQEPEQESDSVSEAVRDAQRNVADLWRQSADNALCIGYWLNTLHQLMDAEKFSAYTRVDLAALGISRSSAYRWMVLGKNLQRIFPNSALCDALVRLGDGRGIFARFRPQDNDKGKVAPAPPATELEGVAQGDNAENNNNNEDRETDRKANLSQMPLTAAAREALAVLPAPPSPKDGYKETNDWARSFIKTMNQARARQRAEKCAAHKTAATQEESLLKRLEDFAAHFGAEAFENFRERLDRLFGPRNNGTKAEGQPTQPGIQSPGVQFADLQSEAQSEVQSEVRSDVETQSKLKTEPASAGSEARPSVAQSPLRTGNLPPAVQAKTSAPVSAPNAVNQPSNNKDHAQGGIASALASPSIVGTANHSPAQAQAVSGAAPDTLVYQNEVYQNIRRNLVDPNKEQTRSPVPSVPVLQKQNAVPATEPVQSKVGTGPSSQPQDPNSGRTIYSDEPRRSPYAIDFDFRVPGCRR